MKMKVTVEVLDDSGRRAFFQDEDFDVRQQARGLIEAVSGPEASARFIGRSVLTEAERISSGMAKPEFEDSVRAQPPQPVVTAGPQVGGQQPPQQPPQPGEPPTTREWLIGSLMPDMQQIVSDERKAGLPAASGEMERAPIRQHAPPPEMNSDGEE